MTDQTIGVFVCILSPVVFLGILPCWLGIAFAFESRSIAWWQKILLFPLAALPVYATYLLFHDADRWTVGDAAWMVAASLVVIVFTFYAMWNTEKEGERKQHERVRRAIALVQAERSPSDAWVLSQKEA